MADKKDELKGLKKLDPHQQELFSAAGFDRAFLRNLCYYDTRQEAYEATERQYEFVFGRRRYKSYETFRIVRNRNLKLSLKKRSEKR